MGLSYAGLNRSPVWLQLRLRLLDVLCGVMMLVSGSLTGEASAAEWSAAPSLNVKGLYNSNLLLSNGNNEVWGQWVSPSLKFKGSTESLEVTGNVKSDFIQYYGSTDRSLTNLYFPLQASYRSDRNTFGFDGGFTRDNTLQGELLQTGLVLAFTQRNQLTAAPSWKFGITERLSWQSGYQYTNVQYEDGIRVGLVNYQVQAVNTGMTYHLGERDQLQLTGEYTSFSVPSRRQDSNYYGAQGGWTHDFGHEMTGTISGGPRFVTSTQDVSGGSLSANSTVWVFKGTFRKSFERAVIQIDGSREIYPSGIGRLVETDRAAASLSHNLTETVTAALNGSLYFVSAVVTEGSSGAVPQSRFSSISPSVSWKFSQWWTLDVSYTYAERAVDDLNQWSFANSTFVMLTYGGPKWSVSR